jgi:hypothetical protein
LQRQHSPFKKHTRKQRLNHAIFLCQTLKNILKHQIKTQKRYLPIVKHLAICYTIHSVRIVYCLTSKHNKNSNPTENVQISESLEEITGTPAQLEQSEHFDRKSIETEFIAVYVWNIYGRLKSRRTRSYGNGRLHRN